LWHVDGAWSPLNMPRQSPYSIRLTVEEDQHLRARAKKYTLPYFQVIRAKMILLARA